MALEIENLKLKRGEFLLEIPKLTVQQGEAVAVLGPSGSGKSTLLGAIAGFLPAESGKISLNGRSLDGLPTEKRQTAVVFQGGALFPHLNVLENVAYGLRVAGVAKAERLAKARGWLQRMEIEPLADRYPDAISGGQAQRVGIARALIVGFPCLLLDEPFSSLDPKLRADLGRLVKDLIEETRVAALLVTHDREDATTVASRSIHLEQGKLL